MLGEAEVAGETTAEPWPTTFLKQWFIFKLKTIL